MNETTKARCEMVAPGEAIPESRVERIEKAIALGVSDNSLRALICASRTSEDSTIVIPAGDHGSKYQASEWARKGSGKSAEWGIRVPGGWRVGPGNWLVESRAGKKRDSLEWSVREVQVGPETWLVAD